MNNSINIPSTVAAVDLGSNSFHMIVGRLDESGTLAIIDRLREPVRLGGGIDENKRLTKEARKRALDCLERFGQRIRDLPHDAVRVVGTNTLRVARNAERFLAKAEKALGHPIEVISGREEARLIYLGVAHGRAAREGSRLVVDIGGGSTELIIGEGPESRVRESLRAGCVSSSRRFFNDGEVTAAKMEDAVISAGLAIYPVADKFRSGNWEEAVGCSGTIKAIRNIAQAEGWCREGLTKEALYRLRDELIRQRYFERFSLETLQPDRRPVLAGGLSVLIAVFEILGIEQMRVSEQSLREGLLYDLIGRIRHEDARIGTVRSAMSRWSVDEEHANLVKETADNLFRQTAARWKLNEEHGNLLGWAAQLHEIGLQVSHAGYHKHGAYLLEHADLTGFSRGEQQLLAELVLNHRRKFRVESFDALVKGVRKTGKRLCVLLRLAVLLHRGRTHEQVPDVAVRVKGKSVSLKFPAEWLDNHLLTSADLKEEKNHLAYAGFKLNFE